ncbi:PLP-dependent aminotransferase family protein [Bacillus sp. Bos-x628]|uniref:MocR-like transcriptional regulator GabR n=1 Tax=Bacillus maqinnsis TaxID=3229854 RepID=UPI00338DF017
MLTIQLDQTRENGFIYHQIYTKIKDEILNRNLLPHDQLPSKRELANSLKVSVNSVNGAYQQLLAEGYLYSVERKGFFVESIETFQKSDQLKPSSLPEDLKEEPLSRDDWYSFSHISVDTANFPFKSWLKCEQKAISLHQEAFSELPHPQGVYELRETIARLIGLARGVKCYPEQLILSAGTQSLIHSLSSILPTDKVYGLENPGYRRLYQMLKNNHHRIETIGIDQKGVRMNDIHRKRPNVLIITPSHQFPTGVIMPISRRIQLLNWAADQPDRYIIEDDYDSEFKYGTDSIPALQSLDRYDKVIYMGTFSKSLLPGLRLSYMVLPQHLLRQYKEKQHFLIQTANLFTQYTLLYFIKDGAYQRHIKRMNGLYEEKRKQLIGELETVFARDVRIIGENAGLHFVAEFRSDRTQHEILQRAKQRKLKMYGMARFALSEDMPGHKEGFVPLVLGFSHMRPEDIQPAVKRLYDAIYGE